MLSSSAPSDDITDDISSILKNTESNVDLDAKNLTNSMTSKANTPYGRQTQKTTVTVESPIGEKPSVAVAPPGDRTIPPAPSAVQVKTDDKKPADAKTDATQKDTAQKESADKEAPGKTSAIGVNVPPPT